MYLKMLSATSGPFCSGLNASNKYLECNSIWVLSDLKGVFRIDLKIVKMVAITANKRRSYGWNHGGSAVLLPGLSKTR